MFLGYSNVWSYDTRISPERSLVADLEALLLLNVMAKA